MLSQTLWSILSGGGSGGHYAGLTSLQNYNNQALPAWSQTGLGNGLGSISQIYQQGHDSAATTHDRKSHYQQQTAPDSPSGLAGNGNSGSQMYPPSSSQFDYQQQQQQQRPASGSGGSGALGQREAHQSQSLILEHLSRNPLLAANISDSVLRQLIDVGQINASGSNEIGVISTSGSTEVVPISSMVSESGSSAGGGVSTSGASNGHGSGGGGADSDRLTGGSYRNQNQAI